MDLVGDQVAARTVPQAGEDDPTVLRRRARLLRDRLHDEPRRGAEQQGSPRHAAGLRLPLRRGRPRHDRTALHRHHDPIAAPDGCNGRLTNGAGTPRLRSPSGKGEEERGAFAAGETRRWGFPESGHAAALNDGCESLLPSITGTHRNVRRAAFLGSKHEYSPAAKTAYLDADAVAVTAYSSLFNIR